MSDHVAGLSGPDLTQGVPLESLREGRMLAGHVGDEPVLLVRVGDDVLATSAVCTHYGAPLTEGLVVGDTVRCPWHHACFNLRTGEALTAPALSPVACWDVERRDGVVRITGKHEPADRAAEATAQRATALWPTSVVIIGAGAAGNAAAEMLRRIGYDRPVTMIGAEPDVPYDRPNLSKGYLDGSAPEEWMPLRSREFYEKRGIELLSGTRVTAIHSATRELELDRGPAREFDNLLIATGADPVRLNVPGVARPHVHYLRAFADARAIIRGAEHARRAVVVGASFIGLEVAASLRKRGLEVHVVGRGAGPLARVLGPDLGEMIRELHQSRGVVFHFNQTVVTIGEHAVTLSGGAQIAADLVVIGIGVRANLALAERAGLTVDRGVVVDRYLETSVPGIFAAGDIASWPDPHTGRSIRVEHWVVAECQGQVAARNMLAGSDQSLRKPFDAVPFFWSEHYDTSIRYVGHAEQWDAISVDGDLAAHDATVRYRRAGKTLAVATVGRDLASLRAELAFERGARPVREATVAT